jgi:hypothetical protein
LLRLSQIANDRLEARQRRNARLCPDGDDKVMSVDGELIILGDTDADVLVRAI